VYKPPIEEFTIAVANVAASQAYTFPGVAGPSIFLCYQGSGKVEGDGGFDVGFGSVVFVAADTELTVAAGAQGLTLSRCVQATLIRPAPKA
jgi:mannose-6-phosphate isomerase class I